MIWPRDMEDPGHNDHGVEPVYDVATRVLLAINDFEGEARHRRADAAAVASVDDVAQLNGDVADFGADDEEGECVVIVSHADTLQITQCAVAGADLGKFSQYRFRNGEVREIFASIDSLPDPIPLTFR
mmetsp:Transcript_23121/g.72034  ORF Transcript_23121/g.72034 Transcript_23121/m.72034 type:complete len:128 (-) Transcript_23121:129-512(-)